VAGTARTTQVRARERARTRLADTLAAQHEREKANEDDLAAFFALDDQITSTAAARDAALTDIARTHDTAPPTPTRASRTAYTNSTTGA